MSADEVVAAAVVVVVGVAAGAGGGGGEAEGEGRAVWGRGEGLLSLAAGWLGAKLKLKSAELKLPGVSDSGSGVSGGVLAGLIVVL